MTKRSLIVTFLAATFTTSLATAAWAAPSTEGPESAGAPASRPATLSKEGTVAGLAEDLSPEIVRKLDARQLERILKHNAELRSPQMPHTAHGVEVLVPLFFFLCVGGIVGGALFYRHRRELQKHQTLRLMIEKGAEIPPQLLTPPIRPRSDLRRGVVLTSGGLGLTVSLALVNTGHAPGVWSFGLIPTLIGLGYLIVWGVESRRKNGSTQEV